MQIFNTIDLYLYAFIVLAFILFISIKSKENLNYSTLLFIRVILVNMCLLILESITWIMEGHESEIFRNLNYLSNGLLLSINPLPVVSWLIYFDYRVFEDTAKLRKRRFFYFIPLYITITMVMINHFYPFVYTISSDNHYQRGIGVYFIGALVYLTLGISFVLSRSYKKHIEGRLMSILIAFSLVPIFCALLQMIFYGLTLLWPSLALIVLFTYILIEQDELLLDTLTGLVTRGQLENRLRYKLKKEKPFTLIMCDIDEFKQINDRFGHEEGDEALKTLASIMRSSVKREDTVCRYAGDEFMIIVESNKIQAGELVIQRIQEKMDQYNSKGIKSYKLSMSFGSVYAIDLRVEELIHLLAEVDEKMYVKKFIKKSNMK